MAFSGPDPSCWVTGFGETPALPEFPEKCRSSLVHLVPDLANNLCLKGCNISSFGWKCAGLQSLTWQNSQLQTNPLWSSFGFFSLFDWIFVLLLTHPKISVPFSLWSPKLPATSGDQFAQCPPAFQTLLQHFWALFAQTAQVRCCSCRYRCSSHIP